MSLKRRLFSHQNKATFASFWVHCFGIILLSISIVPDLHRGVSLVSFLASVANEEPAMEIATFDVDESLMDQQLEPIDIAQLEKTQMELLALAPDSSLDVSQPLQLEPFVETSEASLLEDLRPNSDSQDFGRSLKTGKPRKKRPVSSVSWMQTISKKGTSVREPLLVDPKEGTRQTNSTGAAAETVLGKLNASLDQDGQVWILWLMDSSLSLLEERQELAPQIFSFYQGIKLASASRARPKPKTAVFAFGQQIVPVQADLGSISPGEIARAVQNMPIDNSGLENVLTAVSLAISNVPKLTPNQRIEVIVWTDESGDDLNMLEDTIFLCRQRNARVHVVGPLSVFGMEGGLQQFTLPPPYSSAVMLPVRRGPDSAFPERAQLPLWNDLSDVDWGNGQILPARKNSQDLGGPHLQRLLAPSGPYALTRLALATGGSFTALNRAGDLAAASREQLFAYMPDYRSGREIVGDIDKYPLRRAIIEAAALTGTMEYWPPQQRFPSNVYNRFPFNTYVGYSSPVEFSRTLPMQIAINVERLRPVQATIEQAIETMLLSVSSASSDSSNSEDDYSSSDSQRLDLDLVTPSEYQKEESPRWRAWYDLNLGRLLAHSVRIAEYISHCEIVTTTQNRQMMLQRGINKLTFQPSTAILGSSLSKKRMEMATKLLQRVIEDHADTPWSDLAAKELQSAVGMDPQLDIIQRPPPSISLPLPPQPRPQLPRL